MIKKLNKLFASLKENVFLKYPVTICAIWIAAIFASIIVDVPDKWECGDTLEKIMAFFFLFAAGNLFTEVFLSEKKRIFQIVGFVCSALIAFSICHIGWLEAETFLGMETELLKEYVSEFLISYLAWIGALCVFKMYKNSQESFEKYCISTFGSVMQTSIVYGIFALGLAIIFIIIDILLLDTEGFIFRIEVLLACGLYIPGVILALSKVKEDVGRFLQGVEKYVLLILTLIAFVVIYLYIFKIVIQWELPSNEVFAILSWLFVCGLPIWTMGTYFKKDPLGKIATILPYVFIPFIVLQCICIGLRIQEYGLTNDRYMACLLIVGEVIYIFLYTLKKGAYVSFSFLVVSGLITIYFSAPVLNCDSMIYFSQKARLEKYMSQLDRGSALSDTEIQKFLGAYDELRFVKKGEAYLNGLSEKESKYIDHYKEMNIYVGNLHDHMGVHMSWDLLEEEIDVSGYSKVSAVCVENQGDYEDPIDVTNIQYEINDTVEVVDCTDLVQNVKKAYPDLDDSKKRDDWLIKNGRILLKNGNVLQIHFLNLDFSDERCTNFYMEAYYLEK